MNPEVPERERTPVPRRRWKPLDEPDRRMNEPALGYAPSVFEPAFEMQVGWGAD
jgi:hypothetical protein